MSDKQFLSICRDNGERSSGELANVVPYVKRLLETIQARMFAKLVDSMTDVLHKLHMIHVSPDWLCFTLIGQLLECFFLVITLYMYFVLPVSLQFCSLYITPLIGQRKNLILM